MAKFDQTDLEILNLLQEDAQLTIKELAAKLGLTSTPIFERIKNLEKRGVIDRYVAILNPQKLGKKLNAFIQISIKDHGSLAIDNLVKHVTGFPEVLECHHLTGDADILLKVVVDDIEQYNYFMLKKLSRVANIGQIKTNFSIAVRKYTTAFTLNLDTMKRQ
ncbi:MAG: Lrp/AsnC family transcriptional regulator [Saprospiraceae bacterium]